jgi:hypothetical protein
MLQAAGNTSKGVIIKSHVEDYTSRSIHTQKRSRNEREKDGRSWRRHTRCRYLGMGCPRRGRVRGQRLVTY